MANDFVKNTVKDFVKYVDNGERYPLMHAITGLRFWVFQKYLGIISPEDTRPCSNRRNYGKPVPEEFKEKCSKYDYYIDHAKKGIASVDQFEKMYLKLEPLLYKEVQQKRVQDKMRKWIHQKLKCLNEPTWCGRDEGKMLNRITKRENNIIWFYKRILQDFEKKMFPEKAKLSFVSDDILQSPCQFTGILKNKMESINGMVKIPKGAFVMGSENGSENEKPVRTVVLENYWIDRCEVTNAQYLRFLAKDTFLRKSTFPRQFHDGDYLKNWRDDLKPPINQNNYPVVYVSWFSAKYYCESLGKHLPSEAEWEKAAKSGENFAAYSFGNDINSLEEYAWYNSNSDDYLHLTADKKPNKFQLFDMHGNVWEWIHDWYGSYPELSKSKSKRIINPQGPSMGKYRVLRGGSWKSPAKHLRSSMRGDDSPLNTNSDVGFRCASKIKPTKHNIP